MGKRITLIIDESNWKKYEALRIEKIRRGEGDLYFSNYVNITLANSNLTLEQINQELRRRQKN